MLGSDQELNAGLAGPLTYYADNLQDNIGVGWYNLAFAPNASGVVFSSANFSLLYPSTFGIRADVRVKDAGGLFSVPVHMEYNGTYGFLYQAPPILFDLNNDGVSFTDIRNSTVRFDMNSDGVRDVTGWASADDALLAIDLNGNGMIDDGSEISFQPALTGAISDLEGLRGYDSDGSGFIDAGDARFSDFRVWQDLNQDGISGAGELKTLDESGIVAINLTLTLTGQNWVPDTLDNILYGTSQYVKSDGSFGAVGDVFLTYMTDGDTTIIFGAHGQAVSIDLDGSGVTITDLNASPISFDIGNNGASVTTAWVGGGDALLGLDVNANGIIDSGTGLALGDQGMALNPLRTFDSNYDGRVDANDSQFGALLLWQDVDQDGVSSSGEVQSLGQAGIAALVLPGQHAPFTIGTGESRVIDSFAVEFANGSTGSASNLLLAYQDIQLAPPVVLDFDKDGAGLVPLAVSTARFDMNADGIADQTGWIEQGDALLALDRNDNGLIDAIDEISFIGDLSGATTDMEGLAAYDTNGDTVFDASDTRFGDFRLWFDDNGNGISEAGEVKTLAQANVTAISLALTPTGESTSGATGNIVTNIASFSLADGTTGRVLDASFGFVAGTAPGEPEPEPEIPPPPSLSYQSSQWSGKAKHWRVGTSTGALHVTAREAQGVIDTNAGAIAPASILSFGNGGIGMLQTIILDLDGDGLEARRMTKTHAAFDMDGDGTRDDTGWASDGDGFLVIDRNNDGAITGASELTFLTEKADARNVWEGLATLDVNRDGKLSVSDIGFDTLKIWQDANSNGVSEAGEVKTLAEHGLTEIALGISPVSAQTKAGRNLPLSTATFKRDTGVTATIGTVALAFDPSSLHAPEPIALAPNAQAAQLAAAQLAQAMSGFGANGAQDLARFSSLPANQGLDLLTASAA